MGNPNSKEIKYSIIILIYHRSKELVDMAMECVRSVVNTCDRNESEIILVDNGSTVRHDWDKYVDTYVRLDQNYGIARGWNTGLRLAKGKYMVILGDDTKPNSGYLEALQKAMDMPDCGVANIHVQNLPVGQGVIESYKWFSGACFMLTKNTLDKVGYFDESIFPCTTEDWDYWLRVYQSGLKLYVNYGKSIMHLEGQTDNSPDLAVHNQRLLRQLSKKFNIPNPTSVFCGDQDIREALGIAN